MIATTKKLPRPQTGTQVDERVQQLVAVIKKHQQLENTNRASIIVSREVIGARLIDLKQIVERGNWPDHLSQLGFDQRTAERYMAISRSPLGARIRSAAPNFAARLPLDVQALEALSKLPPRLLGRAVKRLQGESMTRHEIEVMSRELRGEPPKALSAKASSLRIGPSDDGNDDEQGADVGSEDEDVENEVDPEGDEVRDDGAEHEFDDVVSDEDENQDDPEDDDEDEADAEDEEDEETISATQEFLEVCATFVDRLIDEVESELTSEDADPVERKRVLVVSSRLSKRLRRMRTVLEQSAGDE